MTQSQDERLGLPSASSWRRYELCAGSWQLEGEAKRLGQQAHEASPAAQRGELIHAYLAGVVDEDGKEIKLSDSEQQTADFLQERAQGEVQRIFGDQPVQQLNEKRLWLEVNGRRVASGQFDRCIYTPSVALVQDFKTGFGEPDPAEQNAQLKLLAVLVALHRLPSVQEVIVQIVSGPFGVTEARYDLPALAKAYSDVLRTLKAIQSLDAPLNASIDACRYCPAKLICPALQERRVTIARMELITLPDGPQAAMILDDVAMIRSRCDEIVEYYQAKLLADLSYTVPGYAMVPGAVRRKVTDWKAARQRLGEWLELEDIEGAANYRLEDLERALGKKLNLRGKPLKERMGEILNGLIEEKPNAASLKRVSGRPKIVEIAAP